MNARTDTRGRRAGLSRAVVAVGALRVLDREGPGGLTMRRVGDELGVHVMSLYNHVADKDDLLDAIAEIVVAEVPPPDPGMAPDEALRTLAHGLREAVLKHPHAAALVASRPLAAQAALAPVEATLAALLRAGLSPEAALGAFWMLTSYVTGAVLAEAAAAVERRPVSIGPTDLPHDAERFPAITELAPLFARSTYQVEFERGLEHFIASLRP